MSFNKQSLDNYITGHYGEDQFKSFEEEEPMSFTKTSQIMIGKDLREVLRQDGSLGRVVHHHHIREALGIKGKLPKDFVDPVVIGDTEVYVMSSDTALWGANGPGGSGAKRPHRVIARCNHCRREIPAGKFGQHLKRRDHKETK